MSKKKKPLCVASMDHPVVRPHRILVLTFMALLSIRVRAADPTEAIGSAYNGSMQKAVGIQQCTAITKPYGSPQRTHRSFPRAAEVSFDPSQLQNGSTGLEEPSQEPAHRTLSQRASELCSRNDRPRVSGVCQTNRFNLRKKSENIIEPNSEMSGLLYDSVLKKCYPRPHEVSVPLALDESPHDRFPL